MGVHHGHFDHVTDVHKVSVALWSFQELSVLARPGAFATVYLCFDHFQKLVVRGTAMLSLLGPIALLCSIRDEAPRVVTGNVTCKRKATAEYIPRYVRARGMS